MSHHHHHAVHAMTRKNNASSTGLAGKKDAKRSHTSLAHLANEIAAVYEAEPAAQGMERTSSRGGVDVKQKGRASKERQLATEEEDGEGWVSANSSTAVTPEAGTSPMSPESYKPLEIGKKTRRAKRLAIPELTFEKQTVPLIYDDDDGQTKEAGQGTPKQTSGFALGGLSRASAHEKSQSNLTRMAETAQQGGQDGGDITPSAEEGEDSGPPTPRLPVDEAAAAKQEAHAPTSNLLDEVVKSLSPRLSQPQQQKAAEPDPDKAAKEQNSDAAAPPLINVKPRLANMRKLSSSTIRSLTSMHGPRPPLSAGLSRKSNAPLQPTLDTKTQCFGEILEESLSPTMIGGQPLRSRNNVPFPADQAGPVKPKRDRTISGNSSKSNAGTLTAQEAEDLARRLRSVSGTDLQGMDGGYGARAALRRSASSSHGIPLSGNGPGSPRTEIGGAFSTLKRASGYFGSIGRLTGLTGLTSGSSGNLENSPPSPVLGQTVSPAQANLINTTSSPNLGRSSGQQRRTKQVSIANTAPTLQQQQQLYRPPPLISKFIEANSGSTMSFANPAGQTSSSSDQISSSRSRTVSRARQKMITQRDAPYPLATPDHVYTSGRSSDEDPSSSASQLNLRSMHHSHSGTSTPLAQDVQQWLHALAKEMQRIDDEHISNSRWRDELNASVARVLVKLEKRDEQASLDRETEDAEAVAAGGSSAKT